MSTAMENSCAAFSHVEPFLILLLSNKLYIDIVCYITKLLYSIPDYNTKYNYCKTA